MKAVLVICKFRIIILLLVLSSLKAQSCNMECVSTEKNCVVCFQVCQSAQSNSSSFSNCTQKKDDSQDSAVYVYQKEECSRKCCGSSLNKFHVSEFESCSQKDELSKIQVVVIGCFTFLVIVVFLICCLSSKVREKIASCFCPKNFKDQKDKELNFRDSKEIIQAYKQQIIIKDHMVSSQLSQQQIQLVECKICMKEGCDVSAKCGHVFHLNCLIEGKWQGKKCPTCKNHQLQTINLYCSTCHKFLNREIQLSMIQKFNLNIYRESICSKCSLPSVQ